MCVMWWSFIHISTLNMKRDKEGKFSTVQYVPEKETNVLAIGIVSAFVFIVLVGATVSTIERMSTIHYDVSSFTSEEIQASQLVRAIKWEQHTTEVSSSTRNNMLAYTEVTELARLRDVQASNNKFRLLYQLAK